MNPQTELRRYIDSFRYYSRLARRHRFMTDDRGLAMHYFIKASASLALLQIQVDQMAFYQRLSRSERRSCS